MISEAIKRKRSGEEFAPEPSVKVLLLSDQIGDKTRSLGFPTLQDIRDIISPRKRSRTEREGQHFTPVESRQPKRRRMVAESSMAYFPHAESHEDSNISKKREKEEELMKDFNNFNFWKPVLLDIETELAELYQEKMDMADPTCTSDDTNKVGQEENSEEKFNSFFFWRMPVPLIDLDLQMADID